MAFPFTEDHEMIREAAKGLLQDWYAGGKGPENIFRSGTGYDASLWQSFAKDLGMSGIAIQEEFGGAGLGDLGRVVVMEELGASLCAVPFLTSCGIVPDLIASVGTSAAKLKYLPKIASGDLRAAYCDGHNAKNSHVFNVVYADCVDAIVLSRRAGDFIEIFAIATNAEGLKIKTEETLDPTRRFSAVDWSEVRERDIDIIGTTDTEILQERVTQSFIGLAAESIGGAQKCLDLTLGYAAQRVQFDRPIASFQAVKHRCADMFILIEGARSAVYAAATAPESEKTEAALIAKAYATDAFFKVAGDAIQMHGGIGFTWDYPLHFFFKRARANKTMFGPSTGSYDQLADHVLGAIS